MTEFAEQLSTTLDTDTASGASGGGVPVLKADEPASLRDIVAAEVKADVEAPKVEAEGDEKPDDAKEKPDAKPEAKAEVKPEPKPRADDGKFAAKVESDQPKADAKPEGKGEGHIEPPAKLLPDAREKWTNTPRPVQRDIANMAREHEAEVTRYREGSERYETIRHYDEMVRQNGRAGIHETLQEVAQLEELAGKNPIAALNQVLQRAGPRKADGQPYSLFEVAQMVVRSGQDNFNNALRQPVQQQQPQVNPEVEQLKNELQQFKQQQLSETVIEPFKAANPRYEELQADIAFFLKSGRIPASLSAPDRLAVAYDMAARLNPASHGGPAPKTDPEPARRVDEDFSGSKSIKSAPGAVSEDMEPERGGSIRDLLEAETRRARRS